MVKKYNVTVNGNTYQVEVEEVSGEFMHNNALPKQAEAKPLEQPKKDTQKKEEAKNEPQEPSDDIAVSGGEKIECPMPGTILKVNIKKGDVVKKGDVLFILEAMKMENEIMAPHDGKIVQVFVVKGASVNTGDALTTLE